MYWKLLPKVQQFEKGIVNSQVVLQSVERFKSFGCRKDGEV